MRRVVVAVVLVLATLAPMQLLTQAKSDVKPPPPMKLKVGDTAPDFTLLAWDGQGPPKPVSLKDYRGKKSVALAFYVFAFTGG
jgi:AhpC/TSA family